MSLLNWRTHTLVKCAKCKKLMGHHVVTETATCNTCSAVQITTVGLNALHAANLVHSIDAAISSHVLQEVQKQGYTKL